MESAIFDAWRYLRMDSAAFLSKTPREFSILMAAENERRYDEYELMASKAMMMRAAYHKEKLKHRDLYKRPSDKATDRTVEDVKARQEEVMSRLSRFAEFKDKMAKEVSE